MSASDTRQAGYAVAMVVTISLLLCAIEVSIRAVMSWDWTPHEGDMLGLTTSRAVIHKTLTDTRRNVVVGDSHVGNTDYLDDFAFLGRGGLTPFELGRIVRARYRLDSPGRVIVEAGPQLFAENRESDWRSFVAGTFERQHFPLSLLFVEPEFASALADWAKLLGASLPRNLVRAATAAEPALQAANRTFQDYWDSRLPYHEVLYADIDPGVRQILARARLAIQTPADGAKGGQAWGDFVHTIDWLQAHNAEICLTRAPVAPEYEAMMAAPDAPPSYSRQARRLDEFARSRGLSLHDYTELGLGAMPLDHYFNADHMNGFGRDAFWEVVAKACFDGVTARPLLYSLDIPNRGIEGGTPGTAGPVNDWEVRGAHTAIRTGFSKIVPARARLPSASSYGAETYSQFGPAGWWALSRLFRLDGARQLEFQVMVRPQRYQFPRDLANLQADRTYLAEDDAFIAVRFFTPDGEEIPLSATASYSRGVIHQAATRGETRHDGNWYRLEHRVAVPNGARSAEVALVATDGNDRVHSLGLRAGNAAILFDDFYVRADGAIAAIDTATNNDAVITTD